MTTEPEKILEDNLVRQLTEVGFGHIVIRHEADLIANLKKQIEKHNRLQLSDKDFEKVLNHLAKGNIYDKAKTLRDRLQLTREDGESVYVEFINQDHWCQNEYQVASQIEIEGSYKNRYDVTILINGLPLVQIELKRRGLELKEAFNQTNRYQRHSYNSGYGLFNYVQLFVISNGVNTKYYTNNPIKALSFKQTFYWSDKDNMPIKRLDKFADVFLEKCFLSKIITKYIVLTESKVLMVLRPYQYYAVEAILEQVKKGNEHGYIWHTTGSGKTLTSFKASQILQQLPSVYKVVFVVDRNDLDYQTIREFEGFQKGCVDATFNTFELVKQLTDDTKLIVTTIQKLNTAISKKHHLNKIDHLKDKRVVFIFDECHRSQFGETHDRIKKYFAQAQMFGFTGTPIFADNAVKNELGKRTTKELFNECLHKYIITDAIRDENVLRFSIEYVGRYREKEGSRNDIDIEVEDIDTVELLESPDRMRKIVDYIIAQHDRKTHSKHFTAMFCVSSVETLIKYYQLFQGKKEAGEHDLRIVTIFTYGTNEDDAEAQGLLPDDEEEITDMNIAAEPRLAYQKSGHSRDYLDQFIGDYNLMYGTKYTTKDSKSFNDYYKNIAKRIKEREKDGAKDVDRVDILLVVNMFLTGFDAKKLNTLYVDKNLKHHGLIQAFSRTNRIFDEKKSHGNIVAFRNLKAATDDAIALFSDKDAKEEILVQPKEQYVEKFNAQVIELLKIAPTVASVDRLKDEDEELAFVKAFRELLRLHNVLKTFADFDFDDLAIESQRFEDYKSKYLDLRDKTVQLKEKVSILQDVDFEVELVHRDEINVSYILRLLVKMKKGSPSEADAIRQTVINIISGDPELRSKRELIQKFIEENLPTLGKDADVEKAFETFWTIEKQKAFEVLCRDEKLHPERMHAILSQYMYTERLPLNDELIAALDFKPSVLQRKSIVGRVLDKLAEYVDTFVRG